MSADPRGRPDVQRHHWLNAIVGYLDAAFGLDEVERLTAVAMLSDLLDFLDIPGRGQPHARPPMLDVELSGQLYSHRLGGPAVRAGRHVTHADHVVPARAWRDTIVAALKVGYPDLDDVERTAIVRTVDPLLAALGVPDRPCRFLPQDTVIAAREW